MRKYWQTWKMMALNALQETFINRWTNLLFFTGKSIRFSIMMLFLLLLKDNIAGIAGYSSNQVLVFFVTYTLLDTFLQVAYRGVYMFGADVRNGRFDGALTKPIKPLFTVLTGQPDINDVVFLVPSIIVSIYILASAGLDITPVSVLLYFALLVNSFILGTALHIIIVSITIVTTDVDNVIWIYRDITRLGQFPVNIYFELVKLALFFIIPVGMMFTIPSQVLLNTAPSYSLVLVTIFTAAFLWVSLRIWNAALKTYSSASS